MMATAKTVSKIGDKLIKVNDNFTVHMYDNGFMVEAGGRNKKGDYVSARILCSTVDEVLSLVREACEMERDS
jgi:type III secretion system FlhB-like substrate exporter